MKLKNKNAIVTGGSRGIGLEIAYKLASEGSNVAILDIIDKDIDFSSSLKKGSGEIKLFKCDISSKEEVVSFFDSSKKEYGSFNFLINNARYKSKFGLKEPVEEWEKSLSVGLSAPFYLSQELIKRSEDGGSIVNLCSVASKLVTKESPSYHAAKGGLLALNRYLAIKGGKNNIRVNAILPGLIIQDDHAERFKSKTNLAYREMSEKYQPMGQVGTQKDISELVLFLCSDESKYLSGAEINLDGAATIQDQFSVLLDFLYNRSTNPTKD